MPVCECILLGCFKLGREHCRVPFIWNSSVVLRIWPPRPTPPVTKIAKILAHYWGGLWQGHFSLFKISLLINYWSIVVYFPALYCCWVYLRLGNRARTHRVSVDIQAYQIPWSVLCSLQYQQLCLQWYNHTWQIAYVIKKYFYYVVLLTLYLQFHSSLYKLSPWFQLVFLKLSWFSVKHSSEWVGKLAPWADIVNIAMF